jgi:lysophospholipase L1-like esterase
MRAVPAGLLLGIISSVVLVGCGGDRSPVAPRIDNVDGNGASPVVASSTRRMEIPANFPFKKILCFGDSVTLGVTQQSGDYDDGRRSALATVEGYVPKLWRRLEERYGTGFELVTEAVGGENTREALDRIDFMIRRHDPDVVLILTGIVDVNVEVVRFPVVRSNLAEMMRIVQLRGKYPIIGTYPPVNPDGFRVFAIEHAARLNDVIRQEAKRKNVKIADHETAAAGDFRGQGSDGVHPNNIGYETMAQTWFETIEEALEELGVT